jgi:hypothetical protein
MENFIDFALKEECKSLLSVGNKMAEIYYAFD